MGEGIMTKKRKIVTTTIVKEKFWGKDDYYHVIEIQVDEIFKKGENVKVTIEELEETEQKKVLREINPP